MMTKTTLLTLFAILLIVCVIGYLTNSKSGIENVVVNSYNNARNIKYTQNMRNEAQNSNNDKVKERYKIINSSNENSNSNSNSNYISDKYYNTHSSHHDQQVEYFSNNDVNITPSESKTKNGFKNIESVTNIFDPVLTK